MFKNLQKNNKGFTIIEVLIVLAIAGLIMLIVFLAVPALQRNQRNSGRRNDVGRLGGAVSEFYANNNGATPAGTDAGTIAASAGTLSQYTAAQVSVQSGTGGAVAAMGNIANVRIVTGSTCGTGGATTPGTARQVAIQFMVEGGSGNTPVCQEV